MFIFQDHQRISSAGILVEAFKRRVPRDKAKLPDAPVIAAQRGFCSLVDAATNKQLNSMPLATYLLRGDGIYASQDFFPLLPGQAIAVYKRYAYEGVVACCDKKFVFSSATDDYWHTSLELEAVPHYWLVER